MSRLFLLLLALLSAHSALSRLALATSGTSFTFTQPNSTQDTQAQPIFLAGANQAWRRYGADFGNSAPLPDDYCGLKADLIALSRAGANSIRIWVFADGYSTPAWAADGRSVVGGDGEGTLAESMLRYTRLAASMDVLVIWCLWNGAAGGETTLDPRVQNMIRDGSGEILQSYLDSTLIPLVTALKGEPGVGAWEIMNEPEGSFDMTAEADSAEPCFNPTKAYDGGWTGNDIRIWDMARFVAKQIQAIHEIDPEVLVTLGSANPAMIRSDTIYNNFWSDECMSKALGLETIERFVDFYQVHVYPDGDGHMGVWESFSPFFGPGAPKADWKLDKPLVIGEFPQGKVVGQTGQTPTQEFEFALLGGFDGAWGWCMCTEDNGGCTTEDNAGNLGMEVIGSGLARVLELAEEKVRIKVGGAKPEPDQCGDVPPTPPYVPQEPADCTDLMPPEEGGSCADLKMAGGCKEEGTRGYCCTTCFGCSGVLQCGGI